MKSAALLRAKFAPQPYQCVLTPAQWYDLSVATPPTLVQSQELMSQLGGAFYQASWAGINFWVDANFPGTAGTCFGGIFSMDAIGLDIRRGLRIEAQRDGDRCPGLHRRRHVRSHLAAIGRVHGVGPAVDDVVADAEIGESTTLVPRPASSSTRDLVPAPASMHSSNLAFSAF